jgi:hypothetical protein
MAGGRWLVAVQLSVSFVYSLNFLSDFLNTECGQSNAISAQR